MQALARHSNPSSSGGVSDFVLETLLRIGKDTSQPLWIIGNSSSVLVHDLDKIPNEHVRLVLNRFHLSYGLHSLREDFCLSADPHTIKFFGREIEKQTSGQALFFGKGAMRRHQVNFFPLATSGNDTFDLIGNKKMNPFGSSLVAAFQLGLHLGFRQIYLYGVDFDFADRGLDANGQLRHGGDNHFIPDYRGGRPWMSPDWWRIEQGLLASALASAALGVEVLNFTPQHKLKIFSQGNF